MLPPIRMTMTADWILVTGQPGCGKTTAVKKILEFLQQQDGVHCRGFFTEEVLSSSSNTRIGFDVVTVPNQHRGKLSRKGGPSHLPKTGSYSVYVSEFEDLALPTLQQLDDDDDDNNNKGGDDDSSRHPRNKTTVYILDEIGRMELHSNKFQSTVRGLLQHGRQQNGSGRGGIRLVGAIAAPIYGHRVPFCDEVSAHDGVQVHKLKKSNRDAVVQSLIQQISDQWLTDIYNKTSTSLLTPPQVSKLPDKVAHIDNNKESNTEKGVDGNPSLTTTRRTQAKKRQRRRK
jgi:nucleoside-triphosphatase